MSFKSLPLLILSALLLSGCTKGCQKETPNKPAGEYNTESAPEASTGSATESAPESTIGATTTESST